jgi:hypothetical protein
VCFRSPTSVAEYNRVKAIGDEFKSGHSMRRVFAQVAAACAGN